MTAGATDALVGIIDAAPGSGPGGFGTPVCGARVRAIALAPQLAWIAEHT